MASTSSSSMAPQVRKYDVFVSFRGEDTRYGFVSHLSKELNRKKIVTFIDDKIEKGETISEALFKTIEDSELSLIIFSENFASSTWCLKEVAEIIRCREGMGQLVVPVFYHVDPSHVRKQSGTFAEAFAGHEQRYKKKEVQKWKTALTKAANISGWHQVSATSLESELVEKIVGAVLEKLNKKSSSDAEGLVGIARIVAMSPIERVESFLRIGVAGILTHTIGIWGMGGIGKTTIAEVIFDRIRSQFEGYHFLANVREECEKHGLAHVEREFLSTILNDENLNKAGSNMGRNINVKDRLRRSKVLIVLDDVDNIEQFESLAGGSDRFGLGSRVIITTRNKQVLEGRVDQIHEVNTLSDCHALRLFSLYAFKRNHPTKDFEELSSMIVKYSHGNPLALKVLGATLLCKNKEIWESALNKMKKAPLDEIQDKLRISYDGLRKEEKCIFLDIACFFNGMKKDIVIEILDGCGNPTEFGLSVLIDKSLIVIKDNKVRMHDALQQMGRAIVLDESKQPQKRSRLWNSEEAYEVLKKSKGTEVIEVITLDLSGLEDVQFPGKTFARMETLRVLQIVQSHVPLLQRACKVDLSEGLECLPDELRYLKWHRYPLKSLPSKFEPKNLVCLDMSYSKIEELWRGVQDLSNLKFIDLSYCQNLIKTPDFSKAPKLVSIKLGGCTGLLGIHPSVGALHNLTQLDLGDCKKVTNFPGSIRLKSLKSLLISRWSNQTAIEELQESIKNHHLTGLVVLKLTWCECLRSLPSSICQLNFLEELYLHGCSNLENFPEISKNMEALRKLNLGRTAVKELPSSIDNMSGLVELILLDCTNLASLPSNISNLKFLEKLELSGCSNLESFPEISKNMEALRMLNLRYTAVKELPSSIDNMSGLVVLNLTHCQNLVSLPSSICHLKFLEGLYLDGCSNFESFPEISKNMEALRKLDLGRTIVKELPSSIDSMSGLVELLLYDCKSLVSLPSSFSNLKSLEKLELSGCSNLESFPEISKNMKALRRLNLRDTAVKELPSSIGNLSGLVVLSLTHCQNLVSLPSSISNLKSLEKLELNGCSKLESFPEISKNMKALKNLDLGGTAVKELPLSIDNLSGLVVLNLNHCQNLVSLPSCISNLKSLGKLELSGCSNLESFPEISKNTEALRKFKIRDSLLELKSHFDSAMGRSDLR